MFFGKKQAGDAEQMPMMNMPHEGFGPEQQFAYDHEGFYSGQAPMGYPVEPYNFCDPCMENVEMECGCPCPEVYVVQKGDSVYKIAKKFGVDWRELAEYNHLANPALIYPGERLFIPPSC